MADRPDAPARGPTPRSQLARVVVAVSLAAVVGGGPAVAWDLSTQLPRPERPSPSPKPSPWRTASKGLEAAAGGIAGVYLPRAEGAPDAGEEPTATLPAASASAAAAVPSARTLGGVPLAATY